MGKVVDDDEALREILTAAGTIAVVGLSRSPEKDSHSVARYLMEQGYDIIPVNPAVQEVLGRRSFPELAAVGQAVDVVQVFRPAAAAPEIVEQAIQAGARTVWMQLGICHDEAAARAAGACLTVVMDRCMRAEHRRLLGDPAGA
jgi:hypothetical protein